MSIIEGIILGIVQGITEFMPISSSGHLILARELLGLDLTGSISFDVLLHLSTLLVIIYFFWGEIKRLLLDAKSEGLSSRSSKLIYAILLGSIPAALTGFFFQEKIEQVFRSPENVAYALLAGSAVFWIADRLSKDKGGISLPKGFLIGIFQALALIPGVSRSGITISGGLISGLSREESIKFAFLLGIPVIGGAALKTLLDSWGSLESILSLSMLAGFIAAFISGLISIKFLVKYLSNHSFNAFIVYRILLAAVILLFL
jgi:undecaprenyl-diphosphatase